MYNCRRSCSEDTRLPGKHPDCQRASIVAKTLPTPLPVPNHRSGRAQAEVVGGWAGYLMAIKAMEARSGKGIACAVAGSDVAESACSRDGRILSCGETEGQTETDVEVRGHNKRSLDRRCRSRGYEWWKGFRQWLLPRLG